MSLFNDILSTVATIGRIAGALSGVIGSSATFQDLGVTNDTSIEPTLGQAVFFNDSNGSTRVLNNSTQSSLGLFFTGDADTASQQVFIPPGSSFPMSPTFQTYANAGSGEFTIMPADAPAGSSDVVPVVTLPVPVPPPGSDAAVIGAQASQPILPNITVNLGPNITLQLNVPERTLLVGVGAAFTLASIVLLNVRAGNTFVRILNVLRGSAGSVFVTDDDDPQHMTVTIPQGIDITNGLTYVDICVAVGGFQDMLQTWIKDHGDRLAPITDDDRVRLASFAAARKQQREA